MIFGAADIRDRRGGRREYPNSVLEQHLGAALSRILADWGRFYQYLVPGYTSLGQGGGDRLCPVESGLEAVQLLVSAIADSRVPHHPYFAGVAPVKRHDRAETLPVGIAEGCRIGGEVYLCDRHFGGRRRRRLFALAGTRRRGGAGRGNRRQNRRRWWRLELGRSDRGRHRRRGRRSRKM